MSWESSVNCVNVQSRPFFYWRNPDWERGNWKGFYLKEKKCKKVVSQKISHNAKNQETRMNGQKKIVLLVRDLAPRVAHLRFLRLPPVENEINEANRFVPKYEWRALFQEKKRFQ